MALNSILFESFYIEDLHMNIESNICKYKIYSNIKTYVYVNNGHFNEF